jgi:hypothetical protein
MTLRIPLPPRLAPCQSLLLLLTLAWTLAPGSAAMAADAPRAFNDCAAIAERDTRLDCYDQVEARSRAGAPPAGATRSTIAAPVPAPTGATRSTIGAPVPAPATPAVTAPTTSATSGKDAVSNYGKESSNARVQSDSDGTAELVDTVASIKMLRSNLREITLSSGQVWRQAYTQRYMLEKGDSIIIRPSGWGGDYRLYAERLGGFIQVARVDK